MNLKVLDREETTQTGRKKIQDDLLTERHLLFQQIKPQIHWEAGLICRECP